MVFSKLKIRIAGKKIQIITLPKTRRLAASRRLLYERHNLLDKKNPQLRQLTFTLEKLAPKEFQRFIGASKIKNIPQINCAKHLKDLLLVAPKRQMFRKEFFEKFAELLNAAHGEKVAYIANIAGCSKLGSALNVCGLAKITNALNQAGQANVALALLKDSGEAVNRIFERKYDTLHEIAERMMW